VPVLNSGQPAIKHPDKLPLLKNILCAAVSPATGKHVADAAHAVAPMVTAAEPHRIPATGVPPVPLIKLPLNVVVLAAVSPPENVETLPDVVLMPTSAVILPLTFTVDAHLRPRTK